MEEIHPAFFIAGIVPEVTELLLLMERISTFH